VLATVKRDAMEAEGETWAAEAEADQEQPRPRPLRTRRLPLLLRRARLWDDGVTAPATPAASWVLRSQPCG